MRSSKSPTFATQAIGTLSTLLLLSGCGKTIEPLAGNNALQSRTPPSTNTQAVPACTVAQSRNWSYVQPNATVDHAVDLLFVVDTSSSLDDKRETLAAAVPDFLDNLPTQTDTRVAVMLAHGGASPWSGQLYAPVGTPEVINANAVGHDVAAQMLGANLGHPVADVDEANGEMEMYSLTKSLEPAAFAAIQAQGFYRPYAALSVVFITDENDICFDPRQHGMSSFPDFKASYNNSEDVAFAKYCAGITPESTREALDQRFLGKLAMAGIIHSNPDTVPAAGEDAIGHGIIELLATLPDSITLDLGTDYRAGLTRLASVVSSHLNLVTAFATPDPQPLVATSIQVKVDGQVVPNSLSPSGHAVQINVKDAGGAGSRIEITACAAN